MTATTKSSEHGDRLNEVRESRLKRTRVYIRERNLSRLMNNTKWYLLFDCMNGNSFHMKTLLDENTVKYDSVFEVEQTAVLVNASGDFTEFIEIEMVMLTNEGDAEEFLVEESIPYYKDRDNLIIKGYH